MTAVIGGGRSRNRPAASLDPLFLDDDVPVREFGDERLGVQGLLVVVAAGFHGRGVMTAPVVATAVRELVSGRAAPFSLEPFALERFDSRSREFEFYSISDGDGD